MLKLFFFEKMLLLLLLFFSLPLLNVFCIYDIQFIVQFPTRLETMTLADRRLDLITLKAKKVILNARQFVLKRGALKQLLTSRQAICIIISLTDDRLETCIQDKTYTHKSS